MRDRLIELLNKKYDHFCDQCGVNKDSHYTENLADYLLANGVIVPPCKVGDTLYDASEYIYGIPCPEIYEVESDRMTIERVENGDYLFTYDDAYIRHEEMGKIIFATREEALDWLKTDLGL